MLRTLGVEQSTSDEQFTEWNDFSVVAATDDNPATRRLHIGFFAPSRDVVDEFWRGGTSAGYRDDGRPGPRPQYTPDHYGAFLLDPDGSSAEAVHFGEDRNVGSIDHLWIRVADLDASRQFYEAVAPHAGLRVKRAASDRVHVAGEAGSFSLVDGTPTENVHLAFPAADDATVDRFHRALLAAGYRDNGGPGERPDYHPGYHGAFVLDPDR